MTIAVSILRSCLSWRTALCSLFLCALLAGCSGDPRALEEAIEVDQIGLTRLEIVTGITATEQIFINRGESLQLQFDAYSGDTKISVSNEDRRWSVDNAAAATITRSGLLVGQNNGPVEVTVRIGGIVSAPVSITVSDADLATISTIAGEDSLIECSRSSEYTALGTFTDDSVRVLGNVEWSVAENESGFLLAAESDSAIVAALRAGTITLQAMVDDIEGLREITVNQGLTELTIVPDAITVERGASLALIARATYSDETDAPVSELVSWSLDANTTVATLTQEVGETGVLTGVSIGPTSVTATCGDTSVVADVNVIEPEVITAVEIEASEDPLVMSVNGSSEQLRLFARSAGGSFEEVTNSASWSISAGDDNVVDLDDSGSSRGEITPLRRGRVTVTASYRNISDTLSVIVE
ncbi:MAG: Ig-like domain-containing protein [Gammaproteobacteria bacterium]|nr:Ig-like domain-containing protein [Gammaproteobacteria bacterium]